MKGTLIISSIGLAITLFGFLAFHRLALYREKNSRFAKASNKFREAVHKATSHVPVANNYWDNKILEGMPSLIKELNLAVNQFKGFLPKEKCKELEKQWSYLQKHIKHQIPKALSTEELLYGGGTPIAKEAKENFYNRLATILQYANKT